MTKGPKMSECSVKEITWNDLSVFRKQKRRKKKEDWTRDEIILQESRQNQLLVLGERQRIDFFKKRHQAAMKIQKAWQMYKFKTKGLLKNARDAVRLRRLDAGELAWKRQIAACTIQLAWRKYARKKLLDRLKHTGSSIICQWDTDVMTLKQRAILQEIYTEQLYAPKWHPVTNTTVRPEWANHQPSPAALSFNFAINQYKQPLCHLSISEISQLMSYRPVVNSNQPTSFTSTKSDHFVADMMDNEGRAVYYSYNMT